MTVFDHQNLNQRVFFSNGNPLAKDVTFIFSFYIKDVPFSIY